MKSEPQSVRESEKLRKREKLVACTMGTRKSSRNNNRRDKKNMPTLDLPIKNRCWMYHEHVYTTCSYFKSILTSYRAHAYVTEDEARRDWIWHSSSWGQKCIQNLLICATLGRIEESWVDWNATLSPKILVDLLLFVGILKKREREKSCEVESIKLQARFFVSVRYKT